MCKASLPPREEQNEIARRIEVVTKYLGAMSQEQKRTADLLERLDQAILAKAFRGELVLQDANDGDVSLDVPTRKR